MTFRLLMNRHISLYINCNPSMSTTAFLQGENMSRTLIAAAWLVSSSVALGAEITVSLSLAGEQGPGASLGSIRIVETAYGVAFYPALKGLPPGLSGSRDGSLRAQRISLQLP